MKVVHGAQAQQFEDRGGKVRAWQGEGVMHAD